MSIHSSKNLYSVTSKQAGISFIKKVFGIPQDEPDNAGPLVLSVVSVLVGIAIIVLLAL